MTKNDLYKLACQGCVHAARLYARLCLRVLKRSAQAYRNDDVSWKTAHGCYALHHFREVSYFAALADCPRIVRSASASLSRAGIRHAK